MSESLPELGLLLRQQQALLSEMAAMRREMATDRDNSAVQYAMISRLDGTMGLLLTEMRAMHSQHSRLANRVRDLEAVVEGKIT